MKKYTHFILILSIYLTACQQELIELEANDWAYSNPQSHELNPHYLLALDQELKTGNHGEIYSLTILKNDQLVFENYYQGSDPEAMHSLGRGSQSVFYMMADELMKDVDINPEDSLIRLFPEYSHLFENIPQKDKITIYDIMNSRSGLWWNEWDFNITSSPSDADIMQEQSDWVEYVLSRRMIREPGLSFNYNSGHSILFSSIIESRLDYSLKEEMHKRLFSNLGIDDWEWETTPDGRLNTVSGLKLKARDMAKIGSLLLHEGTWKETELVSKNWVNHLLTPTVINNYFNYRMGWFRFGYYHPIFMGKGTTARNFVFLWGEGGQFIFVSPSDNMVVVFTGGFAPGTEANNIFNIFNKFIIPSITKSSIGT